MAYGGAVVASSLLFVHSLDYTHICLANDARCGLYFGLYDSLKSIVLTRKLQDSFFASFALGWLITNDVGLAFYPIDFVVCRVDRARSYPNHLSGLELITHTHYIWINSSCVQKLPLSALQPGS